MAPEQLRGDPVDLRTDVFAFGCVLYEMLSGRRPFSGGSSAEHVSAVLRDDPAPLDQAISISLRAIVRRCLEKRPSGRYQGAGELVAVLENLDLDNLGAVSGAPSVLSITDARSSAEPAVAVMPFANMSGDSEQEYLCDGMSEEILGAIGRVRGVKVLARSSSFAFKGKGADPREVGRTIGADHLLEGSVQRAGDRIRISTRLIQATDGTQLWADRYDRTISDIFELQDEISAEVANQLRTALLPDELGRLQRRHIPDREAHDLYIRGRHLWYRRSEGDLQRAIKLFERAIEIDPEYAEPHAGIAEVFNILGIWALVPTNTAFDRARQEGTLALELDENLASAHGIRGFIAAYGDLDYEAAERHLERAIELDPAAGHYHCWLAAPLAFIGRVDDCMAHVHRAIEVEPMSAIIQTLAGANMQFGDPEKGLTHLRAGFEMQPDNPVTAMYMGIGLGERLRDFEEAIEPLERSAAMDWNMGVALLASYHARLGNLDAAAQAESRLDRISESRYVSPYYRAVIAAGRGRSEEALAKLEACSATGEGMGILKMLPSTFEVILDHPRADALVRQVSGHPVK